MMQTTIVKNELEALQNELEASRHALADAEFARELAGEINSKVSKATAVATFDKLKLLDTFISKSLELVGVQDE